MAQRPNRIAIGIGITLSLLVILMVVFARGPVKRQLEAWKVLPQPEHLTELSFTHPQALPKTLVPDQTQTVAFTVHNLEYRTMIYHYVISETPANSTVSLILADHSFTLPQNKYENASIAIRPTAMAGPAKITVTLTNNNESIDYWLTSEGV